MDRSYWSDQEVVKASRQFVCARLITFEDGDEARLMKRIWGSRRPVNTAFAIMDPFGRKTLTRTGRSPSMMFDDAGALAAKMTEIAERHPPKGKVEPKDLGLPILEDVRIALNVTECDAQQLVVIRGGVKQVEQLRKRLTALCWSKELIGRFLYAVADENTDWSTLDGADKAPQAGVLVVKSDTYGLTGKVVAAAKATATTEELGDLLTKAAAAHKPKSVDTRRLRRQGKRKGLKWQSELPTGQDR